MAIEPGKAYFLVRSALAAVDRTQPVFPTGDLEVCENGIRVGVVAKPRPDWPLTRPDPWIIWPAACLLLRWPQEDNSNG